MLSHLVLRKPKIPTLFFKQMNLEKKILGEKVEEKLMKSSLKIYFILHIVLRVIAFSIGKNHKRTIVLVN